MSDPAIVIKNLVKRYESNIAVRGIDLTIERGEVFGLLGPNGAGKTSIVEILEGYRDRDEGEVEVLGVDPSHANRQWRSRIGIVLQECGFPQYATVSELISLWGAYYPRPLKIEQVIETVGLEDKRNERVKKLSGGQRRRLDLALALVGDPELIFLDEPTTGFDPSARRHAWDVVRNLRDLGKTILLTTHYMDEAQELANRVAVMNHGKIIALGKPNEIGTNHSGTAITFLLPETKSISDLPTIDGQVECKDNVVTINTTNPTKTAHTLTGWALDNNCELPNFSVRRPELEDIFIELVHDSDSTETAEQS